MTRTAFLTLALAATPLLSASSASADPRLEALMPDLKKLPRPDWVKPGARITWWVTTISLVPVKTESGGTKEISTPAMGYRQLEVAAVEGNDAVVDVKNYLSVGGTEREAPSPSNSGGSVLPARGGEYWVHPRALKAVLALKPGPNLQLGRMSLEVAGKKMNVVMIAVPGATWYFDERSGLLVKKRIYSNKEEEKKTRMPHATNIEFRGFEQVRYPWLNATLPAWTQRVQTYEYKTTHKKMLLEQHLQIRHTRTAGGATWLQTKVEIITPGAQPQIITAVSGIGMLGLCLPPRELAKLKPGTVIYRNRFTQSTLSVALVGEHQGRQIAVLRESAPKFDNEWHYDLRSGVLRQSRFQNKALSTESTFVLQSAK